MTTAHPVLTRTPAFQANASTSGPLSGAQALTTSRLLSRAQSLTTGGTLSEAQASTNCDMDSDKGMEMSFCVSIVGLKKEFLNEI